MLKHVAITLFSVCKLCMGEVFLTPWRGEWYIRAQYYSRASYSLLSHFKVKILSCDTTVSSHKRVVTSLSCAILCILKNVPIVLTIFLQGPHIKDSPRATVALVVNFRETTATNVRSLCSFLWTESSSSQPLHWASVEGSCDTVRERNGSSWTENSWQTKTAAQRLVCYEVTSGKTCILNLHVTISLDSIQLFHY